MVSKTAQADVEDMWEAGLRPTFQDIIRLNALALEVERMRASFAENELPRVSFLGDAVFHEPTIGSEMWLQSASRLFDSDDGETFILLRAFSLSMNQDELPDPLDKKAVLEGVQKLKESLMFATLPQVMAAVGYAVHGFKHDSCELPAKRNDEEDAEKIDGTNDCYEIGLLRQGMAYRLGSVSDLKNLPPRTLQRMIIDAMQMQLKTTSIRKDFVSNAEDNYLRTLDEITNRLKMEQKDG